ncbi:RluA family pseudouridine synthase [uncultured Treponema sp.]|uniref:RluA family pseudouridine synthase n=1 Tax=uncultured Treponema sp. TaxID=162155 RepID=UPI0025D508F3|nr:RluA family pseudouridine synthase [uncultured Treponema sp.]
MFPPLPQEKAAAVLKDLIQSLEEGKIELVQVARPSEERKNQGVMLGALVCKNKNGDEVNLVTNSGNAKQFRISSEQLAVSSEQLAVSNYNGTLFASLTRPSVLGGVVFVGPIVSAGQIEAALSENDREIHEITKKINNEQLAMSNEQLKELRKQREKLCDESLSKVHALYKFHCIDGKVRSLKEICGIYNGGKLPPTGTGDCCAPKLLDYAFSHELIPISLAETPHSTSHCSPLTANLTPPCDERCGILLPAMLGLRILYRDEAICVVNKQSGLLSVPGRGEDKQDCIESRFKRLFGDKVEIAQCAVHRLDLETSGVMILAFTKETHHKLMQQFEAKTVQKEYVALLDGVLAKKGIAQHGQMELFFRLDVENRPHQIWDAENGKSAVTEWEILGVERYHAPDGSTRNATRVLFMPHTGRTHQLRLASADAHGFGVPIIGDTLYGKCDEGERLMLHARKVTFTHPVTAEPMTIECNPEF